MRDGIGGSQLAAARGPGDRILTARIGVNSGKVAAGDITAGHGMVAGDAGWNTAALDCNPPRPEVKILIGPRTRGLVGRAVRLRSHPAG